MNRWASTTRFLVLEVRGKSELVHELNRVPPEWELVSITSRPGGIDSFIVSLQRSGPAAKPVNTGGDFATVSALKEDLISTLMEQGLTADQAEEHVWKVIESSQKKAKPDPEEKVDLLAEHIRRVLPGMRSAGLKMPPAPPSRTTPTLRPTRPTPAPRELPGPIGTVKGSWISDGDRWLDVSGPPFSKRRDEDDPPF